MELTDLRLRLRTLKIQHRTLRKSGNAIAANITGKEITRIERLIFEETAKLGQNDIEGNMEVIEQLYVRLQKKLTHLSLENIRSMYKPDTPTAVYALVMQAITWDEAEVPIQMYAEHYTMNANSEAVQAQWQPIETAPKDGRLLIGCDKSVKVPYLMIWDSYDDPQQRIYPHWCSHIGMYPQPVAVVKRCPTHWMSFPKAPSGNS